MPARWTPIDSPTDARFPSPITVRVETLAARSYFPEHRHEWAQVVYAISGVLTVAIEGRSFVISPEQGVWLPNGVAHRVGTLFGAEFRSLWIADSTFDGLPGKPTVFGVSPLLQALIMEAANLRHDESEIGYASRVSHLILDQLLRAEPLPGALPWPRGEKLNLLCEALYTDPADAQTTEQWARELGMSGRTLARRFKTEIGISLRSWRRRMRLFKAIELLGGNMDVTQVAHALGYGSSSAFIYAFRTGMGMSPQAYMSRSKSILGSPSR